MRARARGRRRAPLIRADRRRRRLEFENPALKCARKPSRRRRPTRPPPPPTWRCCVRARAQKSRVSRTCAPQPSAAARTNQRKLRLERKRKRKRLSSAASSLGPLRRLPPSNPLLGDARQRRLVPRKCLRRATYRSGSNLNSNGARVRQSLCLLIIAPICVGPSAPPPPEVQRCVAATAADDDISI